jgi:hypothetical protein
MKINFYIDSTDSLLIRSGRRVLENYDVKSALEFKEPDQIVSDLRSMVNTYTPPGSGVSNDEIISMLDHVLPGWMGEGENSS